MLPRLFRTLRGLAFFLSIFCGGSALAQSAGTSAPAAAANQAGAKRYFYVRLTPPRPTFAQDMTPGETTLMGKHVVYWTALFNAGRVLLFGPVEDPRGDFRMAVVEVNSREEAQGLIDQDPAAQAGMKLELAPMRVGLHR